jgi:hypothetical protein
MNCDCPPARCGGTTIRRASFVATAAPCTCRTRCRHASIPAAVPALVITRPSCTYSSFGDTSAVGYRSASNAACFQCVVHRRPSSSPACPSRNAPEHTDRIHAPRSAAATSASTAAGGTADVSG